MRELFPVQYHDIQDTDIPVFLIGPISGTFDWQKIITQEVSRLLIGHNNYKRTLFVNPRRFNGGEEKVFTPGFEKQFSRQRLWELFYIDKALQQGLISSWGAQQTIPLPVDENGLQLKGYASTTREEYGTLFKTGKGKEDRLVIGMDNKFLEKSIVAYDFQKYFGEDFKVHDTLEEVIWATVGKIKAL